MYADAPVFNAPEVGEYSAQVLADSLANGVRLTTVLATFPRFILAEVNTHRVFSRNSASSRAIPTWKILKKLREEGGFIPATFNERIMGMGIGKELSEKDAAQARTLWGWAMHDAMDMAHALTDDPEIPDHPGNKLNIDKSRANRLLEPFMWHKAIITSTEWDNFFALRCPDYTDEPDPDFPAQWEFQQTALLMKQAMAASTPVDLDADEWHRPMVDNNVDGDNVYREYRFDTDDAMTTCLNDLSARRLAAVSFDNDVTNEPVRVSIDKADKLVGSAHFSPTEHIARRLEIADLGDISKMSKLKTDFSTIATALHSVGSAPLGTFTDAIPLGAVWSGNIRGYWQYRKSFDHEDNHAQAITSQH